MADFQLSWWEKLLLKQGLAYTEHRSPQMKKLTDELSSPALWATLAAAVPLIAQLFTATGNPHLAAAGGAIVAAYAIAVQLKSALLTVPPPGTAAPVSASPALTQAAASLAAASAAHAAAASALPATVAAAKEAVSAVGALRGDLSELIKRADDAFYHRNASAPAAPKEDAAPAPPPAPEAAVPEIEPIHRAGI